MTTATLQHDTLEEEAFWNNFQTNEIHDLQKIRKEKAYDFSQLKKRIGGKN